MKILDKYILKNFLKTFFFTVLIFVIVVSVIDFTENHDDFIEEKVPYSEIFGDYYLNYFPYIANMLSPIMVFIATVVVTAQLAARTEIIAMFNSGMSFIRVLVPYIIGSTFIGIMTFYLIGWVIPNSNKVRLDFEDKYLRSTKYVDAFDVHVKIAPEQYIYMKSYNPASENGYDFTLETIQGNRLLSKLKSKKATFNQELQAWQLDSYSIRWFDEQGKESFEQGGQLDTIIPITPADFSMRHQMYTTLTLGELDEYIAKLKERGSEELPVFVTEKTERYTYPFAIVILTIIGVIVSARKSRQGTGFQIAFGFALAIIYILFVILSRTVSQFGSVGPITAAWTPNIIFTFIGFIMYKTLPR
jgi:lipopolysaccharide export system permease protein